MTSLHAVSAIRLFKKGVFLQNFNFSSVSPTPPFMRMQVGKTTHTVIWPTHTHTLWLARQPASFMKSFLSDPALLNTCVTLSWYHTVSVLAASWFSFNPSWWTDPWTQHIHQAWIKLKCLLTLVKTEKIYSFYQIGSTDCILPDTTMLLKLFIYAIIYIKKTS